MIFVRLFCCRASSLSLDNSLEQDWVDLRSEELEFWLALWRLGSLKNECKSSVRPSYACPLSIHASLCQRTQKIVNFNKHKNNKFNLTAVSFRMLSPSPGGSPSGSGTHRWGDVELGCDWTWPGSEWGFSCELVFVLRGWTWVWSSVLGGKSCVSVAGWGSVFGDKVPSVTSNKESRSISKSTVLAAWIRAWSLMDPIKLRSGSVSPEPPPPAASAGHRGIVGTPVIAAAFCDFSTFCRSFSFSLWNFFSMLVTLSVPTDFFFFFFISPSGPVAGKVLQDEQIKRMRHLGID